MVFTSSKSTHDEFSISLGGYPVNAHSGKIINSTELSFAIDIAFLFLQNYP